MHAFLIVGNSDAVFLAQKLNAKVIEFPLQKIEDTRALTKFLRLSVNEKTIIQIKDIDSATNEAANAFLKNLEEPQENIYFALSTTNLHAVLPTIVSRCQVIRVKNNKEIKQDKNIQTFLDSTTKQRALMVDKIKERPKAIEFVEGLIFYSHQKNDFRNQEVFLKTLRNLKANGNVGLQLMAMVVGMDTASKKG